MYGRFYSQMKAIVYGRKNSKIVLVSQSRTRGIVHSFVGQMKICSIGGIRRTAVTEQRS